MLSWIRTYAPSSLAVRLMLVVAISVCGGTAIYYTTTLLARATSVSTTRPNLRIFDVQLLPSNTGGQDNERDVAVVVENAGTARAGASSVTIVPMGESFIAPPIEAQDVRNLGEIGVVGPFQLAGVHQIQVCADLENAIAESNEDDNCSTITLEAPGNFGNIAKRPGEVQLGTRYIPSSAAGLLTITAVQRKTAPSAKNGNKQQWSFELKNTSSTNIRKAKVTLGYAQSNWDSSPISQVIGTEELNNIGLGQSFSRETTLHAVPTGAAKEFKVCIELMQLPNNTVTNKYCYAANQVFEGNGFSSSAESTSSSSSSARAKLPNIPELTSNSSKIGAATVLPDDCGELEAFIENLYEKLDALGAKAKTIAMKMLKTKQTSSLKKSIAAIEKEAKQLTQTLLKAQEKLDSQCSEDDSSVEEEEEDEEPIEVVE